MPLIDINNMTMFYDVQGEGQALILLHGGMMSSSSWEPNLEGLAQHFKVYTLDSRGHGLSNNPIGQLSYRMMADDVAAFVEELGLQKPFVGGWSDGGQITLELGMRYSDLFSGLIAGAAWYSLTDATRSLNRMLGFNSPGFFDKAQFHQALVQFDMLESFSDVHAGGLEQLYTLAEQLTVPFCTDLNYQTEDFAKISIPTLVIQGDRDNFIALEQAIYIYQNLKHGELSIIPNGTHSLPWENPQAFNAVVIDFVKRHSGEAF
jgi:pimeloyl-ACP methyl ester carboxylesterase